MRLRTVLGIALFSLGVLALVGAIYFRSMLKAIRLDSVYFQVELEDLSLKFRCTLTGYNPSFLKIKITNYKIAAGEGQLPIALLLSSRRALDIPTGKFRISLDLFQEEDELSWTLGGGLDPSILDGVQYRGALHACTSLLCSTLRFKGIMALE